MLSQPGGNRIADRLRVLQRVIPRHLDDGPVGTVRWHPERVALALDHQHRDIQGVELAEAALCRVVPLTRWMNREGQAQYGNRTQVRCRPAGNAGTGRASAHDERQSLELIAAKLLDDRGPGSIQLPRRRR